MCKVYWLNLYDSLFSLYYVPVGRSTFPKLVILNEVYPGIKLLLGKQELCKKSGFLDQNPKRANRFQVIKGFRKKNTKEMMTKFCISHIFYYKKYG